MKHRIKRAALGAVVTLTFIMLALYLYARSFKLEQAAPVNRQALPADIAYLKAAVPSRRGRILAVVSSAAHMRDGRKPAGYELTELARAYYVFETNGYEVDIASPLGGKPPARIDEEDMEDIDYAFLNDDGAKRKLNNTIALAQVDPAQYTAVYFAGGKGAMFDLPGNPHVARIVNALAERGVIGAVCHGPAALLDIALDNGRPLVAGRRLAGFTNEEELFLMSDARAQLPFLLEDRARERGAIFADGAMYVDNTVTDGRLVTGQNPWSTWSVAEGMVRALGHTPVARASTAEERSVRMLAAYYRKGLDAGRAAQVPGYNKVLILMHAWVAAMRWNLHDAFQLQRLARG